MFQDLPSRIESRIHSDYSRERGQKRLDPRMIEELIAMGPNPTMGMYMALGLLRDQMPWIYESGMETIRFIKSKATKKDKDKAVMEFEEIIEMTKQSFFIEEYFMSNNKEDYILFRELPRMLRMNMYRLIGEK